MRSIKTKGEPLLKAQTVVCLILIAVMLLASFLPIYSVEVSVPSYMQYAMDQVESVLNDPLISSGDDIKFELPERLNVNLFFFIRSAAKVSDIVDLYKSILEVAEYRNATSTNEYYQAYNKLQTVAADAKEIIGSREFLDMMALASVLTNASANKIDLVVTIIMIVLTVVLPVTLLFSLLIALFGWLIFRRKAERSYLLMMKVFRRAVRVYLFVLAMGLINNAVNMSLGIIIGLIACIFGFCFCAICSRFKDHTQDGKKYLNIVQGTSAMKLAAFFGFYFCAAHSGVIGEYVDSVMRVAIKNIFAKTYGEEFLGQYLFMLGAILLIIALVFTLTVLTGTMSRLGGMLPRNKETAFVFTSASLVLLTVPVYSLKAELSPMLILAYLCAVIMIACDVTVVCLRRKFCSELRESEKDSILRGLQTVETERFDDPEDEYDVEPLTI